MRLNTRLTNPKDQYIHCSICKDGSATNQLRMILTQLSTNSYCCYSLWLSAVVKTHPCPSFMCYPEVIMTIRIQCEKSLIGTINRPLKRSCAYLLRPLAMGSLSFAATGHLQVRQNGIQRHNEIARPSFE